MQQAVLQNEPGGSEIYLLRNDKRETARHNKERREDHLQVMQRRNDSDTESPNFNTRERSFNTGRRQFDVKQGASARRCNSTPYRSTKCESVNNTPRSNALQNKVWTGEGKLVSKMQAE
jgi:hypothetical protein